MSLRLSRVVICKFVFCVCGFVSLLYMCSRVLFCRLHIWEVSYSIRVSLSGFLHLVWQSLDPPMLLRMAVSHFLCGHSCVCVCVCERERSSLSPYPVICDGHLDCFHVLDTVSSAAINMCVFEFGLSLAICPGVGLQGHMVALFLFFREPPYCSLYSVHQFTFLPTVWEGPLSSTPSTAFTVCRLLMLPFWLVWGVPHWSLFCISLVISNVEHLFTCLFWPLIFILIF